MLLIGRRNKSGRIRCWTVCLLESFGSEISVDGVTSTVGFMGWNMNSMMINESKWRNGLVLVRMERWKGGMGFGDEWEGKDQKE